VGSLWAGNTSLHLDIPSANKVAGIWQVQNKYLLNQGKKIFNAGFLMASCTQCLESEAPLLQRTFGVSNHASFLSGLLIFHLTGSNCPSLHESRQESQNPFWSTEGSTTPILLPSSSETPLGSKEPVPIFLKKLMVKRSHQKLGC
jgi:hypothetical protein